jgi:hypothetical protein
MWTPLTDTTEEGEPAHLVPATRPVVQDTAPLRPRDRALLAYLYEGLSLKKAADAMGMAYITAKKIVAKEGFKKAVGAVDQAIVERISRGEFGAMAIAKAAAVGAMERLKRLSETSRNERVYLQANLEIIRLSGLQPPKPQVLESPERLIDLMTADEAEAFASTGEWPERFRDQLARLATSVLDAQRLKGTEVVVGDVIREPERVRHVHETSMEDE